MSKYLLNICLLAILFSVYIPCSNSHIQMTTYCYAETDTVESSGISEDEFDDNEVMYLLGAIIVSVGYIGLAVLCRQKLFRMTKYNPVCIINGMVISFFIAMIPILVWEWNPLLTQAIFMTVGLSTSLVYSDKLFGRAVLYYLYSCFSALILFICSVSIIIASFS